MRLSFFLKLDVFFTESNRVKHLEEGDLGKIRLKSQRSPFYFSSKSRTLNPKIKHQALRLRLRLHLLLLVPVFRLGRRYRLCYPATVREQTARTRPLRADCHRRRWTVWAHRSCVCALRAAVAARIRAGASAPRGYATRALSHRCRLAVLPGPPPRAP